MVRFLMAATAAFSCIAGAAYGASVKDIAYSGNSSRNVVDIYTPDGASDAPLLVYLHGGAWLFGDKGEGLPLGTGATFEESIQPFLDRGIAVASMNYRLAPADLWDAQLEDLQDAFAFLRANGGTYGYDASRMGSMGFSAGGHLSAWAGLALADDPATRLDFSITWSAPTDLFNMDADDDADIAPLDFIEHDEAGSPESQLIGAVVKDNKALADAASPAVYASGLPGSTELPAWLIMHGDQDPLVSSLQAQRLADAIIAQGGAPSVELRFLPGGGHGGAAFNNQLGSVVNYASAGFGLTQVPLPASLPLVLAGMLTLAGLGRRRG